MGKIRTVEEASRKIVGIDPETAATIDQVIYKNVSMLRVGTVIGIGVRALIG